MQRFGFNLLLTLLLLTLGLLIVHPGCSSTRLDGDVESEDADLLDGSVELITGEDTVAQQGPNLSGPYPYKTLSEYRIYKGELKGLQPNDGVLPFEVASVLWSDGAVKHRFFVLPPSSRVEFGSGENWVFPVGSIVVKNFSFPADFSKPTESLRVIETRLLIKETDGWTGHVYLWRDDQTEADLKVAGKTVQVSYLDTKGQSQTHDYIVPNVNQCANCHSRNDRMRLLGPITPQINRTVTRNGKEINQLQWLAEQGFFSKDLPTITTLDRFEDPLGTGPLEKRARAYLHANCSHCHRSGGLAGASGLLLVYTETDTTALGYCKRPVAAGNGTGGFQFDIVPGNPDTSVMVHRMSSVEPGVKMPELPNLLVDKAGVQLISDWISTLTPAGCPSN